MAVKFCKSQQKTQPLVSYQLMKLKIKTRNNKHNITDKKKLYKTHLNYTISHNILRTVCKVIPIATCYEAISSNSD